MSALRYVLEDKGTMDNDMFNWINEVPIMVTCFIWRTKMGPIPSVVVLAKRSINLESITCCLCNLTEETSNHVLVRCSFAKPVIKIDL